MSIRVRDLRRHADLELRREGHSALAAALDDSMWHGDSHCRECGFLERVHVYNGTGQWRCVSGWHDCWRQGGWSWYGMAMVEEGYLSHHDLISEDVRQFPRYEVNPGSFACWLFRPGEALSVHYWQDGRWREYLALKALAG